MKRAWKLQDAKNRFSNLVNEAQKEGPQIVTKRGIETVIVLSMKDYRKLIKPRTNLVDFFQKSPLHGIKLDIDRSKEPSRKVEL
ncbi:MAG TPA: type II toxin-antitoxin system Phd/YefM family antitoxin [Nitrospirae bacterium]|nr:type II toxin-antitoxin system Phd/YefM family antitoxin [Nitrospirota bacterium]HDZ01479.1 type II toxin-antitoxin system Phd/YefM family antitoxin [Nitrospirota bacterium]